MKYALIKWIMLNYCTNEDLVDLNNQYCDRINDIDRFIFSMDEFNSIFFECDPLWLACRIYFGTFNPMQSWWTFDGHGNLTSRDYVKDIIWIEEIAQDIEEHFEEYNLPAVFMEGDYDYCD